MRGEFEFKLTTPKKGRAVPRTTPPLEADASNLRGSFRQTLRYSTTSESAAQGNQQTGGRVVCTNRRLLPTHKGSDGTSNSSYYNTDPDRHSTKNVAMGSDGSTRTEHRNDQHPKGMLTTHALFAWKMSLTQGHPCTPKGGWGHHMAEHMADASISL